MITYAFLTAYAPRALDISAFFQVKIDRMRRSWKAHAFLNWFCSFVVHPVDLHMVERRSSPASSAPSPAVVPSEDKERRKKVKLMRAEAIERPSEKGWVARYWCGSESQVREGHPSSEKATERPWGVQNLHQCGVNSFPKSEHHPHPFLKQLSSINYT